MKLKWITSRVIHQNLSRNTKDHDRLQMTCLIKVTQTFALSSIKMKTPCIKKNLYIFNLDLRLRGRIRWPLKVPTILSTAWFTFFNLLRKQMDNSIYFVNWNWVHIRILSMESLTHGQSQHQKLHYLKEILGSHIV